MPTHIDILCGHYQNVVYWNEAAIEPTSSSTQERRAFNIYTGYRQHNYHFVIYGAMFLGRSSLLCVLCRGWPRLLRKRCCAGKSTYGGLLRKLLEITLVHLSWCASPAGEKRPSSESIGCPMIQNFTARRRRMCIMLALLDTPPLGEVELHWKRRHFITPRSNACQKAVHCITTKWWIFWLSDQRWCAARSLYRQKVRRGLCC